MTTIVLNHFANPFNVFFKTMFRSFEIIGYSRAATELSSMGYHEEAAKCMKMLKELRKTK